MVLLVVGGSVAEEVPPRVALGVEAVDLVAGASLSTTLAVVALIVGASPFPAPFPLCWKLAYNIHSVN